MEPREYSAFPAEYSGPPLEHLPPPEEFRQPHEAVLPDEFRQGSGPDADSEHKKSRKKWLYGVSAVLVTLMVAHSAQSYVPPVPADTPEPVPGPEIVEPEPEPEPTPEPPEVVEQEPERWPLGDGMIFLTVYNNSFDMDAADDPDFPYVSILMHEMISEPDWEDMDLPAAKFVGDDWEVAGYVLHYNAEYDYGYDSTSSVAPFVHVLAGGRLTREDIELVPPDSSGARYVNVHVMWTPLRNYDFKMRLELDPNDGSGDVEVYEADQPFASEGYTYLAAFQTPEREGYTFTGWYDEEGNKVEYISYYDFFPLLPDATSNEDRDWSNPITIRLKAGWKAE